MRDRCGWSEASRLTGAPSHCHAAAAPAGRLRNNGRRPGGGTNRMTDQPAAARVAGDDIERSQQRWRDERDYLNQHRPQLTRALDHLYPAQGRVAGTRLLARPQWQPARPVPLAEVAIDWRPDEPGPVVDPVQPDGSDAVRPWRADGTRFASYADALAALRPPRLLENRTCYRILDAQADQGAAQLTFGMGRYFDLINASEAVAHEAAHQALVHPGAQPDWPNLPLRDAIGDPLDLARRSAPTGICTLILRRDRDAGTAQMFLHWRDPASVAVNGGLYQVAPAGMFQPSDEAHSDLVK